MKGMSLQEISDETGTTKQNIQQTISRGIKKLFKNAKKTYNLSHLNTFEMLVKGLELQDESDIKYLFKNLDKFDRMKIQEEGKNGL